MRFAVASPSSLSRLYFFRHAIFQPSGLALSLVFYGTDVSISAGSLAILWLIERSQGNAGVMSWMGLGLWGDGEDALGLGRKDGVVVTEFQGCVILGGSDWKLGRPPSLEPIFPTSGLCVGIGPAIGAGRAVRGIALQGKSHFKQQQCVTGRGKTHGLQPCSGFKLYRRRIKIKERKTEREARRKKNCHCFTKQMGKFRGSEKDYYYLDSTERRWERKRHFFSLQ